MQNLPVYNTLEQKIMRKEGFAPYLRVQPRSGSFDGTVDQRDVAIMTTQIERHVDDVDSVHLEYEETEYIDTESGQRFKHGHELIVARARAVAGLEEIDQGEPLYSCTFKRLANDQYPTHTNRATWANLVDWAFTQEEFAVGADALTIEQLETLQAVRKLRVKLSTSE